MSERYRSFADPIDEFITFDKHDSLESLALELIDTAAFQRLRNIKQLGIIFEVYPSATHTRFTHSLGTFYLAREICNIIKEQGFEDKEQRDVALIAALLHDIGHGPQSHIFEYISKKHFGINKSHEQWGSEIIANHAPIANKLERYRPGFARQVANFLVQNKADKSLYSSIISSSLDADRMDYLSRDRNACGVSGCNIDKVRLLNSMQVVKEPSNGQLVLGIKANGLDAVEEFLRSRMSLYNHIYDHRREQANVLCMDQLFAEAARKKHLLDDKYSPLEKLMKGDFSIDNFLETTDADITRFVTRMSKSDDSRLAFFAKRISDREAYKCHEISTSLANSGQDKERIKKIIDAAQNRPGTFLYDKTIRAYDPHGKDCPIYIVFHRENYKVRELSEVSDIANSGKRVIRAYTPRQQPPL